MARRALRRLRAPRMRSPRAPRAHGGLTRTAPALVPPPNHQAWKRGWFPRNVSDVKALKGMAICDEGALPLKPTIPPKPKKQPPSWLAKNWLTLLAGVLGGALLGVGGTLVAARKKPEEGRPYLAMPGGSA